MVHVAPVGSGAYPAQPTIGIADQNTALSHAAMISRVYECVVIFWPKSTSACKKLQFCQVTIHETEVTLLEHKTVYTYIRSADAYISINGYHSKQSNAGHPKEYIQGSIDLQERYQ